MPKRLPALAAAVLAVVLPAVLTLPRAAAQSAPAATTLKLPLPGGSAWKVIQGYNGGTHVAGPEQYALDLVRDGGPTGGTEVVAPAAGAVWFAHAPGAGNGCASITLDGGDGLIVQMCHMILHRAMRADERVSAGQSLGTIGDDGRVGNNGAAHLHLSIHRTPDYGVTRIPYPFSIAGGGLPLEGLNLPPNGSFNQYACPGPACMSRMISSMGATGVVSGQLSPTAAAPAASAASAAAAAPAPTNPPAATRPSPPPAPPAGPLRAGVRAVVANAGSGDCVNIREGPTTSAPIRQCLPDGARLRIVEGPISADGYQWWRLEGLGWAAGMYLSPLAPSLEVGGRARVNAGAGDCLNARAAPGIMAPRAGCLAHGTAVRIVAGPLEADGVTWWQVEGGAWLAGEYLVPDE